MYLSTLLTSIDFRLNFIFLAPINEEQRRQNFQRIHLIRLCLKPLMYGMTLPIIDGSTPTGRLEFKGIDIGNLIPKPCSGISGCSKTLKFNYSAMKWAREIVSIKTCIIYYLIFYLVHILPKGNFLLGSLCILQAMQTTNGGICFASQFYCMN